MKVHHPYTLISENLRRYLAHQRLLAQVGKAKAYRAHSDGTTIRLLPFRPRSCFLSPADCKLTTIDTDYETADHALHFSGHGALLGFCRLPAHCRSRLEPVCRHRPRHVRRFAHLLPWHPYSLQTLRSARPSLCFLNHALRVLASRCAFQHLI